MSIAAQRYVPEFDLVINGEAIPAELRASISSMRYHTGLEGSDRVELALVNQHLRWLDHPLVALGNSVELSIGYAPDLLSRVFVGEVVGQNASFPAGSAPTLTVVAQDKMFHLQKTKRARWFAVNIPKFANVSMPDPLTASIVSADHGLMPVMDPIGASLAVLVGGAQVMALDAAMNSNSPSAVQKLIRKQVGESDYDFLKRIARQNGWEMYIEHDGPTGGHMLRFSSPLDYLMSDLTLKYGQSLLDFTPRITNVGQIAGISVKIWRPEIKMEFVVTVSWDWDRSSLDLSITPGFGVPKPGGATQSYMLVNQTVTIEKAPRIIVEKLLPKLNNRLTGSGSTIGDPRIRAGTALRLEGLGRQFGGLYRVTAATHTIDSGGYRTNFDVRKDIWFGSIPLIDQGAVAVKEIQSGSMAPFVRGGVQATVQGGQIDRLATTAKGLGV